MTPEEFWAILHDVPAEVVTVRRLYYSGQGEPLFYSMEDLPGLYIEVDQHTYINANHAVKIVDGKLIEIKAKQSATKLHPTHDHGICCDPRDVCVIVADDQPNQRWSLVTNGQD